ncbi:hypothetical protein BDF20DRAFT_840676 [Mycotypha africana]|uniref:uncharacterized protein n=1 Tax=Mycotypha africana TaxID=64632 RepID=UPI002301C9E4|nr:uncharacterized protein BDF20DRAFT_840676 [Mycotypha africana]KAI8990754.1 hypothetical protein BDF20DRAFT_840676 [Mycotypha africana]
MAQVRFFDLELLKKPGVIWSPNTCKTRYALNLKQIPYETKWVNFDSIKTVIPEVTKSDKRPLVPVIVDLTNGDKVVEDSWEIALYLEKNYSHKAGSSLFNGNPGVHRFFQNYCDHNVIVPIFRMVVLEIHANVGPEELQNWFRQDRESKFGQTLEEFAGSEENNIKALKTALVPINKLLAQFSYITGETAGWADVVLASHFQFFNAIRPDLFETAVLNAFDAAENHINTWWNRMQPIVTGTCNGKL